MFVEKAEEYVDTLLTKDDSELDKFLDENLGDLKLTKKQAGTLLGIIKGIGISSFLAGLKDPILQQGFEIICKENAELKEKISYLEDNLRVARKDRENLQLDVARGLKEFVKDFPATSLRYLANEKYIEQLTKAKKIIKNLMVFAEMDSREYEKEYKEAEQFLKEAEE